MSIEMKSRNTGKTYTFFLSNECLKTLDYGHKTFKENFEFLYNAKIISITQVL